MEKSRENFILDAHAIACEEWKEKIESEFPKLFKDRFNVGDFVLIDRGGDELADCPALIVYDGTPNPRIAINHGGELSKNYTGGLCNQNHSYTKVSPKQMSKVLRKALKILRNE